jgi:hypothetical protein
MITLEQGQDFSYASSVKTKLQKLTFTAFLAVVCSAPTACTLAGDDQGH